MHKGACVVFPLALVKFVIPAEDCLIMMLDKIRPLSLCKWGGNYIIKVALFFVGEFI